MLWLSPIPGDFFYNISHCTANNASSFNTFFKLLFWILDLSWSGLSGCFVSLYFIFSSSRIGVRDRLLVYPFFFIYPLFTGRCLQTTPSFSFAMLLFPLVCFSILPLCLPMTLSISQFFTDIATICLTFPAPTANTKKNATLSALNEN